MRSSSAGGPSRSLIRDPVAVLLVLAAVVYLALWLEERFAALRALGAALVGILIGMALSNSGVLPGTSPAYQWLSSTGVNLSVALILLNVNLSSLADAGLSMLAAFGIGAAATATGAITGAVLWGTSVGPESWKLAGQFTGTYTGGGMNFAALGRAFQTSSDLFSAAVAADVALTAVWMAACLVAPLLLSRGPSDGRTGARETARGGQLGHRAGAQKQRSSDRHRRTGRIGDASDRRSVACWTPRCPDAGVARDSLVDDDRAVAGAGPRDQVARRRCAAW